MASEASGTGQAIGHHGEIFQGAIRDKTGRLHRSLISLPCGGLRSEATFHLAHGKVLSITPAWKTKARTAAQLALDWAHVEGVGGHLELRSDTPTGWGLGSSTSDVIAALRAVFSALQMNVNAQVLARLAVKAEAACDSTIFNHNAVLFAHREGEVLQDLGGELPECEVLGFNTDPSGTGIDTLQYRPARYAPREIDTFGELVEQMRKAIQQQDIHLMAGVATTCARINQTYLPKPRFERIEAVMDRVGAIGIQVAHSGTVVGMMFDPRDALKSQRIQQAREELAEIGFARPWHFSSVQAAPLQLA